MRLTQTLFGVRQKDNEPLRAFLKLFTTAKLESPDASEDLTMSAFIQGLKEGELHTSLIKKAPRSIDDLLQRATKYVNLEEAVKLKKGENSTKSEKPRESDRGKMETEAKGRVLAAPGRDVRRGPRYDTYTPLIASHERVLMEIWEYPALRWPSTWVPQPNKPGTYGNG